MALLDYRPPLTPYLEILYRDDAIVVVQKPSGLLSVPGKDPAHFDSVWSRVRRVLPTARIVHRLDMATSGIIVLALSKVAQAHLQRQFEARSVSKRYRAKVWGKPPAPHGTIELPLRCDWPNRPKQQVDLIHGKKACTHYRVANIDGCITEVELTPVTGRSHQLRVHMQALGTPILGDKFYATGDAFSAANRLLLHAEQIRFVHPLTAEPINFNCPADF